MKAKVIGYRITLVILEFVLLSGGMADLFHRHETVEGMLHLGYPLYFVTILGFWKVLGGIALLLPGFPRVREWAYAGIFFNFSGAVVSHIACGDDVTRFLAPLLFAMVTVASWALHPSVEVHMNRRSLQET